MKKNSDDFSIREALRLAQSDTGQQLLGLLQAKNSGALQQAMDQAAAGDYQTMMGTMSALLSDPQAKALLEQLGRQKNG